MFFSIGTHPLFFTVCKSSTTGKAESQLGIICHWVGRDQQQKKPPATQQWSTFSLAYCVLDGFLQSNYFRKILSVLSERKEIFCKSQGTDKRTDACSRHFMIWKINSGLVWAAGPYLWKKSLGPIMSNFWGRFFLCFQRQKIFFFENIIASALKSCIEKR